MFYGTDFDVGIYEGCDREAIAVLVKREHCRPKQEKVQRPKVGLEGPHSKPQMF